MTISTIIPAYNASQYLPRCLDSIIEANIPEIDLEVILVNDGSTDNSLEIAQNYAEKYTFIKVFDQPNQGPSAARNLGNQKAKGEYITFVDSDDFLQKDYYKTIVENIQNKPDVIIFGHTKVLNDQNMPNLFPQEDLDIKRIQKILEKSVESFKLLWFPWNKAYKKEIIEAVNFNEKIKIGEDTIFNLEVFTKANSIKIIDKCLYNYVHNEDSLTQVDYKPNLLDNMIAHYEARKRIHDINGMTSKIHQKDIAQYYIDHILFWLIKNLKNNPLPNQKIENLKEIRNSIIYKESLPNYTYNWKHPKKSLIIKLFELRWFNLLLRLI